MNFASFRPSSSAAVRMRTPAADVSKTAQHISECRGGRLQEESTLQKRLEDHSVKPDICSNAILVAEIFRRALDAGVQ